MIAQLVVKYLSLENTQNLIFSGSDLLLVIFAHTC
jgi:hypothetical protein